jgi:hypothetical protein
LLLVSSTCSPPATAPESALDSAAAEYLRLAVALGQRDPDSIESEGIQFLDAPATTRVPLARIASEAAALATRVRAAAPTDKATDALRSSHLADQLMALHARAEQVQGRTPSIHDELKRLFGIEMDPGGFAPADPPTPSLAGAPLPRSAPAAPAAAGLMTDGLNDDVELASVRQELDRLLPGRGTPADRLQAFDERFTIPDDRLPAVIERAMAECRARTITNLPLPDNESVIIRYVTHRPWSGYSRYLGRATSAIEINRTLPLTVDRALNLACHEGYPGHHVYNTLRDARLVQTRGWREFSVTPLFSPESFLAEAAASAAASMIFSGDDKLAFERDVLFPLAGLDAGESARYLRVVALRERLEPVIATIVRRYLSGELDFFEACWALEKQALMKHPQATLRFVNQFRGYALAYTEGKAELAALVGADARPLDRWRNLLLLIDGDYSQRPVLRPGAPCRRRCAAQS